MNIGFRAHDFGKFENAKELGKRAHEFKDSSFIQLALSKVIPSAKNWKDWDEEYISSIAQDLQEYGVSVAVIGCYINPVHPDENQRKNELLRFKKSLSLNKAFGCKIVGTETGSANPDCSWNALTGEPKTLETMYRSVDFMLNEAIKADGIVALEAVTWKHTICSVERMSNLLDKFNDEHLKVIYDPINLSPMLGIPELDGTVIARPSREAQEAFFASALDAFGNRICALHLKDYNLDENGWKVGDYPATTGVLDWQNLFKNLEIRNIDVPILLENFNPDTVKETLITLDKF